MSVYRQCRLLPWKLGWFLTRFRTTALNSHTSFSTPFCSTLLTITLSCVLHELRQSSAVSGHALAGNDDRNRNCHVACREKYLPAVFVPLFFKNESFCFSFLLNFPPLLLLSQGGDHQGCDLGNIAHSTVWPFWVHHPGTLCTSC